MGNNNEGQHVVDSYVTPLVISAVGILFTMLILASCFFIFWWHYLRPHQQAPHDTNDNTVSLIKISNGVPEEILNKIPIITYSSSSSSQENNNEASGNNLVQSECSICLGQFKDEEKLRVLPSCRHNFHVPCIDAWLKEHTNCPVCRSPIIACDCESSSSAAALPTDSSENGGQQRVLHVIPIDHHHQVMDDDDDDVSAYHSRFQQPHPVLHRHSHSASCQIMKKKPRSLGMRLKRSLSMDQSSLYIVVTIQRDQEEAASASSSSSYSNSTKGVVMSRYKSKSLRRVLMRSFSQFRNSGRSSGILPN